ncbi:NAD-dependent epimerase/dehydratase family protein [Chloroflexi bacterium TSY]|nr:NAD-dependent epimerase/dehydratase family protein [Chloroflexi bacterium TSY]
MNVLITGGTGFIGYRLAQKLAADGDMVRVFAQTNNDVESKNAQWLMDAGIEVICASITDKTAISEAVVGMELVYHLAAAQHEANVSEQHFDDVNVRGTQHLLDACVKAGIRRLVYGSTIGVYGTATEVPLDEDSPQQPENIYGITKQKAEELVLSYREKLPVVVVRISETYGPGDYRLLKLFKGIQKGMFFKIGPGTNEHHLIYVDDLIAGMRLAASKEEAIGQVFVLAGKDALTTDEMIDTIANGLTATLFPIRIPLAPFDYIAALMETIMQPLGIQPPLHRRRLDFFKKSYLFSSEKAVRLLEFEPQISFAQGVEKTAEWYAEQGYLTIDDGRDSHARQKHLAWRKRKTGQHPFSTRPMLSAKIEQFDSFWEGPDDVEKGYTSFGHFYRANYLPYVPKDRKAKILCISCGPGYFVHLLQEEGYQNVLGIDSELSKVRYAAQKGLNCIVAQAMNFLEGAREPFDVIICEQELNHLTKEEMVIFLRLCWRKMSPGATLIVHGLNGANPLTGSDAAAQNFDHFNTFTEYSLQQVLEYSGFVRVRTIPLNLYVFFDNPLNFTFW